MLVFLPLGITPFFGWHFQGDKSMHKVLFLASYVHGLATRAGLAHLPRTFEARSTVTNLV